MKNFKIFLRIQNVINYESIIRKKKLISLAFIGQ